MTDKQKLEKIKVLADEMYYRMQNLTTDTSGIRKAMYDYHQFIINEYYKEEPVNNTTLLYGLSGSVGIEEAVKETEEYKEWQGDPERQQSFIDFAKFGANYKHKTSNDLEKAADEYADGENPTCPCKECLIKTFKAGAQWQKQQLIDKACEWLKSYRQDTPDGTGYIAGIVNDKTIEEFKQVMKE